MKAQSKTLRELCQTNALLTIPFFQRQYVWKKENLDTLLSDIDIVYELSQSGVTRDHFMGSVILKSEALIPEDNDNNIMARWSIIDGQQRMTTLMVLLKVLHLLSGKSFAVHYQLDNDSQDPLISHNRSDKPMFDKIIKKNTLSRNLLSLDGTDELTKKDDKLFVNGEDNRLAAAFYYFLDYYSKKLGELDTMADRQRMANSYINLIGGKLQFISIELDANEEEQKIFDTINSLGVKLTTGELLKNFFFKSTDARSYDASWAPVFEAGNASFWSEIITKGTKQESNLEQFFYAYMLVKMWEVSLSATEKKIFRKKENLFENYKSLVASHGVDKSALVNEIVSYAQKYYEAFEDDVMETLIPENACLPRLRVIMQASNTSTLLPYLLYIQENVADAEERNKIYGYLESYLVRRIICKSKTNSYSDLFSENLINSGVKTYDALMAYIDAKAPGDNLAMPDDAAIIAALQQNDLRRDAALILYLLQSKSHPFRDNPLNGGLKSYISDPLMPVNNSNWPAASDPDSRAILVTTLGNQALLRMTSNVTKKVRESDFTTKKSSLAAYISGVPFTDKMYSGTSWDESQIAQQNATLAVAVNMYFPAK